MSNILSQRLLIGQRFFVLIVVDSSENVNGLMIEMRHFIGGIRRQIDESIAIEQIDVKIACRMEIIRMFVRKRMFSRLEVIAEIRNDDVRRRMKTIQMVETTKDALDQRREIRMTIVSRFESAVDDEEFVETSGTSQGEEIQPTLGIVFHSERTEDRRSPRIFLRLRIGKIFLTFDHSIPMTFSTLFIVVQISSKKEK